MPNRVDLSKRQTLTLEQAIDLGQHYHRLGDLSKAEKIYQKILETEPNHPVALNQLGFIALQVGKNGVAEEFITKAINIKPDVAEAHCNLGTVLREFGRLEESVASYHKALAIKPDLPEAHSNLGTAFQILGELEEAVASYHKALTIKPDYAKVHSNLGVALQKLGRLEEAVASYQNALTIKPNFAEAHNNLGNVLTDLGKLEEAVECCHKALAIKPDYAEAYNNLGNANVEQGRLDDAVANYHKALHINPNYAVAYINLGAAQRELGHLNEAVNSCHNVLTIKPDYAEAHYNLGITLQELGKLDEAVASYQSALDIKPGEAGIYNNIRLSLLPICHDIITNQRDASSIERIIDSLPTPPEPDILRLQLKSLTGGNTQEAWENVVRNLPTTQSETIFNGDKITPPSATISEKQSQRNMVALLHFGRSGSGYLHSLLDGHPKISTLPGVYMSGFFGREVWSRISSNGFEGCPEQFSSLYKVLFNARNPDKIPPLVISGTNKSVGVMEGFANMGPNRDTPLTLDRSQFLDNLSEISSCYEDINHGQFFEAIHHAYEKTLGNNFSDKRLIFYHLHVVDPYSMANFLKYFPNAQLLIIIRNPLQNCESWVLQSVNDKLVSAYKAYAMTVFKTQSLLTILNSPVFLTQDCAAVRLEDIKTHPEETMGRLCAYLGIEETASLYASTMQGLKWWGDPSSSLFGRTHDTDSWDDDPIRAETGAFFSATDQFVLKTLFYPFSARFGYVEEDDAQFRKDLREVRPLLDKPLDFEQTLAKDLPPDYPNLELTDAFKSLHAVLIGVWRLLDEHGTYPYMVKALPKI